MIHKLTYWKQLRIQRFERKLCTRCGKRPPKSGKLCETCKDYCAEKYRIMIRRKYGREPRVYKIVREDENNSREEKR